MVKHGLVVLVVALFLSFSSIAQINNSHLEENHSLETLEKGNFVIEELIINQLYSKRKIILKL